MNRTPYLTTLMIAACLLTLAVPAPASAWKEVHYLDIDAFVGDSKTDCDYECFKCAQRADQCVVLTGYSCGASQGGCTCWYTGICL